MLNRCFDINFEKCISMGLVCCGRFKSKVYSVAFASEAGKICVFDYNKSTFSRLTSSDLQVLSVNGNIMGLCAWTFDKLKRDVLLIGTDKKLLAFDLENNQDVFYKEIPDGCVSLVSGTMGKKVEKKRESLRKKSFVKEKKQGEMVAVVGGQSFIQAFDQLGEECFWTVTGDNVNCLALVDFDRDGVNELVAGSEGGELRVYKEDEVISEDSDVETVIHLLSLGGDLFASALINGTFGVCQGELKKWRIKSKHEVCFFGSHDFDKDGNLELITAFNNGMVDIRKSMSGEIIYKESLPQPVAGVVVLSNKTSETVLFCCSDGTIHTYNTEKNNFSNGEGDKNIDFKGSLMINEANNIEQLQQFQNKYSNLLEELKTLELLNKEEKKNSIVFNNKTNDISVIPSDTIVKSEIFIRRDWDEKNSQLHAQVELFLFTNNDTLIRGVVTFGEGIFDGESIVNIPSPSEATSSITVILNPLKDLKVKLHIKIFLSSTPDVNVMHVIYITRDLPIFSMYLFESSIPLIPPRSFVKFSVEDRPHKLCLWANENFLLSNNLDPDQNDSFEWQFFCLRDSNTLIISMDTEKQVTIKCDNPATCGEILQSLSGFLGLVELSSEVNFPLEFKEVEKYFEQLKEMKQTRSKLEGEIMEKCNQLMLSMICAEDARILNDLDSMRKSYLKVGGMNREACLIHTSSETNNQQMDQTTKNIYNFIQKMAKLRVGKSRSEVTSRCREAFNSQDFPLFLKISKYISPI